MTTTTIDTPRVWIGSLAAYNEGTLLGDWFDAIDAPTDSRDWIERMVERRLGPVPVPPGLLVAAKLDDLARQHEELWVFDHENFLGLLDGECSPVTAQHLAVLLDEAGDDEREAFAVWLREVSTEDGTLIDFRDAYCGIWDSFQRYAEEYVDDVGFFQGASDTLSSYFDYERFARDLQMDYDVHDVSGGQVAVFRS